MNWVIIWLQNCNVVKVTILLQIVFFILRGKNKLLFSTKINKKKKKKKIYIYIYIYMYIAGSCSYF